MPRRTPEFLVTDSPSYKFHPFNQLQPRRFSRPKLFVALFVVSAMIGLGYTFARNPVYVSNAIVLIRGAALTDQGTPGATHSPQTNVLVHAKALRSPALIDQALEGLPDEPQSDIRLSAVALPEADAVELRARGPEPEILPGLLDAWLTAYSQEAQRTRRDNASHDSTALGEQLSEIESQIASKRSQIDQFRETYDIVSLEREENRVLAALQGLNTSLDQATRDLAKASAHHQAITDSIANGRLFLSPEDKTRIEYLQQRATALRAQLKRYEESYTPEYMALDSKFRDLHDELATIEQRLETEPAELQQNALRAAEQSVVSAEALVASLTAKLKEERSRAKEFDKKFGEYATLEREIEQLQEIKRNIEKRLVEAQVAMESTGLQLKLLQEPDLPSSPAYPHYARDAGISLAAALAIALAGVILYEFLTRPDRTSGALPHPWPALVPVPRQPLAPSQIEPNIQLDVGPVPRLGRPHRRELSPNEVLALLAVAPSELRQVILLLLCGVRPREIVDSDAAELDPSRGVLQIEGDSPRTLALPDTLRRYWASGSESGTPTEPALPRGIGQSLDTLDRALADTAHDAGLAYPQEVGAETLRHTYLAYLVRQGLRISDLKQIAGHLPPDQLDDYRRLSPPGPKHGIDRIQLGYALDDSRNTPPQG
jgi:succinoglycan biosynthesis transport protein ExoP